MTKHYSDEEMQRLLAPRPVAEPPSDLASRIKAEIPDELPVAASATGGQRGRGWFLSAPLRLLAASVLLGIGVGWVTASLVRPPENLARDIALDGVLTIPFESVEVLVPPRWQAERRPSGVPVDARATCLTETARHWRFPPASGVTIVRLSLFADPGQRMHRTDTDGALRPEEVEPVVETGLGAADSCLGGQSEARVTLFLEIVAGSDGSVVWVETTAPS
jgi:hypothetical protein